MGKNDGLIFNIKSLLHKLFYLTLYPNFILLINLLLFHDHKLNMKILNKKM